MRRTDADELVSACCLLPADGVRRAALSDKLAEDGDEELAAVLSEGLVRETLAAAHRLGVLPSVRLLYAVWVGSQLKPTPAPAPAPPTPEPRRVERRWPTPDDSPWSRRYPDVRWGPGRPSLSSRSHS